MIKHSPRRPSIVIPQRIDVPRSVSHTLPNGVQLHVIDCTEREVVRISFVFRAGSSLQEVPFSASATANLLSEGAEHFTSQQIAEQLDFYGSYYDVSLDRDYAVVTFCALSKFLPQTLELAREILLHPSFPQEEVTTYCTKRKQRLAVERSKISVQARELFSQHLFGATHPYGVVHPEERYDTLTRSDIIAFYQRHYTAPNCFVVCSGHVGPVEEGLIAALAADIPQGGDNSLPQLPPPTAERFAFGPYPDAVQSAIRMGRVLFPRPHPDFIAMQVAATVLGGYFGSRLVQNLREQHGYTYGAFATMVNLQETGYLAIATEVAAGATADALRQIFTEIERLRRDPVPESELRMVRNILLGEVMRILDGPFGIADVTIENIQNGTDNGYLDRFLHEVRDITPERIREVADRYLAPEDFTTVVAGDAALHPDIEPILPKK